MALETRTSWGRQATVSLMAGLLLAGLVGTTGAGAHPGHDHGKGTGEGGGLGIEVTAPADEEWSGFHLAVQWADTAEVDDQAGELVYAGSGCTPISYAADLGDFEGNIAIADSGDPDDPTDLCPASTFAQKVNSAELAGAVAFVQIPAEGEEPNANATAVSAGIPALEVHRTEEIVALRDAVAAGATVEATLIDDDEPLDVGRLSDEACEDGLAADTFECDGIDLLSFVPQEEFAGAGVSDLWGWTDPEADEEGIHDEYVVIGKTNGVAFFRVTDPTQPEYLGELPNDALLEEIWHDVKVYEDHAFIVSESAPHHGMKVFDLTRLRDVEEDPDRVWDEDVLYPLTFSAHNIEIDTESGYAYIVGGNAGIVVPDHCLSGLHVVDISAPQSPQPAGCYVEEGGPGTLARTVGEPVTDLSPAAYVHDTQCEVYDGPDDRYEGRELCFNSAEDKVVVVDMTDKLVPETLAVIEYDYPGYTHQGWLTEDHRFFVVNDELDELDREEVENTRTIVIDLEEIADDAPVDYHRHDTRSITHNNYIVDGLVYQSNYTSGLRVLDTAVLYDGELDPGDGKVLEEIAWFDTFPAHGRATFEGTWSNYPFFESGTIAVSGIDEGLFLLRLAGTGDVDEDEDPSDESGVELSCVDCELEIRAGEADTARLEVSNTGDGEETYELTVDAPEGWTASAAPAEVALADGGTQDVEVTVDVPSQARTGSHTVTVTATSISDSEVSDTAGVEVDVRRGPPSQPGPPDGNGNGQGPPDTGPQEAAGAVAAGDLPAGILAVLVALGTAVLGAPLVRRRLEASRSS